MRVSEIFYSIQGEGRLAGVVSVFVRLAGCDLRCRWCDTGYALQREQGESMTVGEIVDKVNSYKCGHIVVTGGEPLIEPGLEELLGELAGSDKHITLETSATQWRAVSCDLVSISPKLANSTPELGSSYREVHEQRRLNIEAIQYYISDYDYQLKFVVKGQDDLGEIEDILGKLAGVDRGKVMLMPAGGNKKEYSQTAPIVVQMCIENRFRYCPRLQIELWDGGRGR